MSVESLSTAALLYEKSHFKKLAVAVAVAAVLILRSYL